MQPGFAVLLAIGVALLWRRAHGNGLRRGLTWDCGYAEPTARMQYTGGSLADLAGEWFGWAFGTERQLRRPRGFFPSEGLRVARVPEAVLERLLDSLSFEAPDKGGEVVIDRAYVDAKLGDLVQDPDMSRYIL